MNMKKVLASVAASALAISSLAVAAFADTVSATIPGGTVHHATVTYTKTGTVGAVPGTIDFTVPTVSGATVEGFTVELTAITSKEGNPFKGSQTNKGDETISFNAIAGESLDKGTVSFAVTGAEYSADITVKLKSSDAFTASDEFSIDGTTGKLVVEKDTQDDASVVGVFTIGTEDHPGSTIHLTKQQARDLNENGGKITFNSWDNSSSALPLILKVTVETTSGADKSEQSLVLQSGGADVVVEIPAGFALHTGDESVRYDQITVTFTTGNGVTSNAGELHATDWSWGFWDANLEFASTGATTPDDNKTDETTTAPDDVTPGDTTTDGDNAGDNGAGSGNNGSTAGDNGDDKNQPTGVVLAIVPAAVAAAGVIISKKRK